MSTIVEYSAETVQAIADSANAHAEWFEQGRAIAHDDTQRQFAIGDWLAKGDEKWGRKAYDEARSIFRGYTRATLKDFCQISRRVPVPLRNGTLSWAHHKAVARLDKPDLQKKLLAHAAEKGSSVSVFRKHINEKYPPKKAVKPLMDAENRWRKVDSLVSSLYGSLPADQRAAEVRVLAERLSGKYLEVAEAA